MTDAADRPGPVKHHAAPKTATGPLAWHPGGDGTVGVLGASCALTVPGPMTWLVGCSDAAGREATLGIRAVGNAVTIGLPAGESATLTAQQRGQLQDILAVAARNIPTGTQP